MIDHIIITLSGVKYKVKRCFAGLLLFEEMTGSSVEEMKENLSSMLRLFYCLLKANNSEIFTFTFDEFVNLLDENDNAVVEFNSYLVNLGKYVPKEEKKRTVKRH